MRAKVEARKVLANAWAARIGPTVCDEDGPMPIRNRSRTPSIAYASASAIRSSPST